MSSNQSVFGKGMARAKAAIVKQLIPAYRSIARDLLFDAVELWEGNTAQGSADYGDVREGNNMTGNTINSYMAGVYQNSSLIDTVYAWDVGVTDRPTAGYSMPGDMIMFWHQAAWEISPSGGKTTYENKSHGIVRQYKSKALQFQEVGRGNGIEDASAFLRSYHTDGTNLLSIVIVVAVPYAEYLENVRKLDVLKKSSERENVRKLSESTLKTVSTLEL